MTPESAAPDRTAFDVGAVLSESWRLFAQDPGPYILAAAAYFGIVLITCGLGALVMGVFMAGYTVMGLAALRGGRAEFREAFAGFEQFGSLFLLWIVMAIAILVGTALCVLPGIYLALAFSLALPLVVDRRMPALDALLLSVRTFNANLGPMLAVTLVLYVIHVAGSMLPFGFLVAQPLCALGATVLYARIFGLNSAPSR
jgi:hypothetical protein